MRTAFLRRALPIRAELPHTSDMHLWMQLAAMGDVGRINGPAQGYYRVHDASMQRTVNAGTFFDLFLAMLERPEGTTVRLEYRADQFDAATIRTMLDDFAAIVEAATREPEVHLNEIPVSLKRSVAKDEPSRIISSEDDMAGRAPGLDAESERLLIAVIAIWKEIFGPRFSVGD